MKKIKLRNIKTNQKVTKTLDVDVFYSPYLQCSNLKGGEHTHQESYFDEEGNEYRPDYGKFAVGSSSHLKMEYNKGSSFWINDSQAIVDVKS